MVLGNRIVSLFSVDGRGKAISSRRERKGKGGVVGRLTGEGCGKEEGLHLFHFSGWCSYHLRYEGNCSPATVSNHSIIHQCKS